MQGNHVETMASEVWLEDACGEREHKRPVDVNQRERAAFTHLESQTPRGQITTTLEVGGEGRQRP